MLSQLRRPVAALSSILLGLASAAPLFAHEGHEHGDEVPAPAASPASPRLALESSKVELVAVREPSALVIYVDDYATNAPLDGLVVQLRIGTKLIATQAAGSGTYTVPDDVIDAEGETALPVSFLLHGSGIDERLDGLLPAASNTPDAKANAHHDSTPSLTIIVSGVFLLVLASAVILVRRRRSRV